MSPSTTYVYLMSEIQTVRIPIDHLALRYAQHMKGATDPKTVSWAKSRLLSFGCEPCAKCDFTGQKNAKFLGRLRLTLKKGSVVSDGMDIKRLENDVILPEANYFLQAPKQRKAVWREVISA